MSYGPVVHSDYIKNKYGDDKKPKLKKKKPSATKTRNFKIVDDDVEIFGKDDDSDEEIMHATKEEKPQIAGVIDERPNHLKAQDIDRQKWKTVGKSSFAPIESKESDSKSKKKRHDSDVEDLSPPRSSKATASTSRRRQDSDIDLSPPRRRRQESPPTRRRHDSDQDLSPPRRKRHDSDQDLSPPRRRRHDSDQDLSPPRRPRDSSIKPRYDNGKGDLSPPRKRHDSGDFAPSKVRVKIEKDLSPKRGDEKMSSGARAGLADSKSLREDTERIRKRQKESLNNIADEFSGRNAKTVYRDRSTGKIRDLEAEARIKIKADEEEAEKNAEKMAKYKDWSVGLKQREDQQKRLEEDLYEMSKPLARRADDSDMDKMLREREIEDDPMLQYIRKKRAKEMVAEASSRGETVEEKPRYKGPAAPLNRFNIQPGYRWDGVDRSNGFEKKLFERQNEKIAISEEAYKWSTQDM